MFAQIPLAERRAGVQSLWEYGCMSDFPLAEPGTSDLSPARDASPTAEEIAESRLDELTRKAHEDGLYDVDADAYREALAQARKQS